MNQPLPHTPFSTALSGSARTAELRIRNIFSGPNKRPPAVLIVLVSAACLLCGNLVSCQQRPAEPVIVMETQYYDTWGNYIEIPALVLPNGEENTAVDAMNAALDGLREEYALQLETASGGAAMENQCLFYPSTTDRYLNLLFFRSQFTTDLNTGHVFSLVYDRKEEELVSTEDALALAGLNEQGLLDQVTEQVQLQLERDAQEYGFSLALHKLTLEGFRIKADGQPVFYLTGREDDVDDEVLDRVSGSDQLYIWEDRKVDTYDQYNMTLPSLVPAEETDVLDPPLWNQWYFSGGEPAGGLTDQPAQEPAYTYIPGGADPHGNNFYEVLFDCYAAYEKEWNIFYADYGTESEQDGELRLGPAVCLGEIPWDGDTYAVIYDVYYTFYYNVLYAGSAWGLDWDVNREMLVLSRSTQDGSFTGLLGRADYDYRMEDMEVEALIRQIAGG